MSKFPQLVQLGEYAPVPNCNPFKSAYPYNSPASHSSWFMAIFPLHSHLLCSIRATSSLPSSASAEATADTTVTRTNFCWSVHPSHLVACSLVASSWFFYFKPSEPPPPPLLLPTYNSQAVRGCRQPCFLLPDETHMARKANDKKVNKSRGIWAWFCLWVRTGSFSQAWRWRSHACTA